MITILEPACLSLKPGLRSRLLLSRQQATELESTFKTLGNATRLRILHVLARAGELCVGDIASELKMKPQAVSNQLQRLSARGIVDGERRGLQIHYRIVDSCVVSLLEYGWCLTEDATASRKKDVQELERAAS